jgi:hypothetical protein
MEQATHQPAAFATVKPARRPLDEATQTAFTALKPVVGRVLFALQQQLSPQPARGTVSVAPFNELVALLPSLPPSGLPRCIDYVLEPLLMLLPAAPPVRGGTGSTAVKDDTPSAAMPLHMLTAALRVCAALVTSAGAPVFCGVHDRADALLLRCGAVLAVALETPSQQPTKGAAATTPAGFVEVEEAVAAALCVVCLLCEWAAGARLVLAEGGGPGDSESAAELTSAPPAGIKDLIESQPKRQQRCVWHGYASEPHRGRETVLGPLLASPAFAGYLLVLINSVAAPTTATASIKTAA